jgi:hypothetical protein
MQESLGRSISCHTVLLKGEIRLKKESQVLSKYSKRGRWKFRNKGRTIKYTLRLPILMLPIKAQ